MDKKNLSRIYLSEGILSIIFLIFMTLLYPYIHKFSPSDRYYHDATLTLSDTFLLPIGFILIFLSVFFLYRLEIKRFLIIGSLGWIIMGIVLYFLFNIMIEFPEIINSILWMICTILLTMSLSIIILLFILNSANNIDEQAKIRKEVIDLGTKYTRLEIREISEKCEVDRDAVSDVIKEMIAKSEIYAEFYKSSKTISFNQQANIGEIDELMNMYEIWENEQRGKK